jgi:ABC-type antimicrobial peptide transport system permease subunit
VVTHSSVKTKLEYDGNKYIGQGIAYIDKEIVICNNESSQKISTLNNNEIVIDEGTLNVITNNNYFETYESNKNKYDSKEEILIKYLKDNSIIGKSIKTNVNNGKLVNDGQEYAEYKIVGISFDEMSGSENTNSTIYYSKGVAKPLMVGKVHCKSLMRKVETLTDMKKILSLYPVDESDELSSCIYSDRVIEAKSISYLLIIISKYGVVFFLIFASLILMSIINSSIKYRKKEIGILRALGCRSIEIIKMFLYESIILMLIALGVAFLIIPKIINAINTIVIKSVFVNIEVLKFGTEQMLEIAGIMLIIVILANVIPVRRITKMKPIDAILDK